MSKRLCILLIILAGFLAYLNTMGNGFVWDDRYLIAENRHIRDFSHIAGMMREDIGTGSMKPYHFYRPLQMFTYAADYRMWGLNPAGYHLTNVIAHCAVAVSFFWLLTLLGGNLNASLIAALVFAVHPVNTEAVAYISGRADLLAAFFMIVGFIFYIRGIRQNNYSFSLLLSPAMYMCALLSKESSIVFLALMAAFHLFFRERIRGLPVVCFAIVTCGYLLLRVPVWGAVFAQQQVTAYTIAARLPLFLSALWKYLGIVFVPLQLHYEYGPGSYTLWEAPVIGGMACIGSACAYMLSNRKKAAAAFGLAWFFITLLPVSNLIPANESYMMEHWLYVPLMGLAMAVGAIGWLHLPFFGHERDDAKKGGVPKRILSAAVVVILGVLTVRQNRFWKDDITLYQRALQYSPASHRVLNNLCIAYYEHGRYKEAIEAGKAALQVFPGSSYALINLANAYRNDGDIEEAGRLYRKALSVSPDLSGTIYLNLGLLYMSAGDIPQAIEAFGKSAAAGPHRAEAYYNIGKAYQRLKRTDEAIVYFKKAIVEDPQNPNIRGFYRDLVNAAPTAPAMGKSDAYQYRKI